jgi:hypothetical protein
MKSEDSVQHEVRTKVDDFMRDYMGETVESQAKGDQKFGAMNLVDSWFNPEPQLIKHLIIIQMIAAMIVTALMIIVEGQNMNPLEGMLSIVGFMGFAAFTAVMYNRF